MGGKAQEGSRRGRRGEVACACSSHHSVQAEGPVGLTEPLTTSRRWFCLPSTLAHQRRFEPSIRVGLACPSTETSAQFCLHSTELSKSTVMFRLDCLPAIQTSAQLSMTMGSLTLRITPGTKGRARTSPSP